MAMGEGKCDWNFPSGSSPEIEKEREQLKAKSKTAGQLPSSGPQAKPSANILRWRLCLQRSAPPMAWLASLGLLQMIPAQRWSLGRLGWSLVIRLPQSSACQRSLVEVPPTIPVCTLAGSVGLYVRTGIARCVKPLAQSRNETNSSWVNGGGAGAIPRICANSSSGRLISSNVATWVLSNQHSNIAPQTSQDARPVCGIKNFASVRSYSAPQLHLTIVAILGICARNRPFSSA